MGNHESFAETFAAKMAGLHLLPAPIDGGTIDMQGLDGALALANSASALTWKLPVVTTFKPGVSVSVSNKLGGTITVQNQAGVQVDTVASGELKRFTLAGSGAWTSSGGMTSTQAAQLAALLTSEAGTAKIPVSLLEICKEDGTQMIKQATTVTGYAQLSNKNLVIHIPANSTAEAFVAGKSVPLDIGDANNGELVLNVVASKGSDVDVLTFDAEIYARLSGAITQSTDAYAGDPQTIVAGGSVLQFAGLTTPSVGSIGQVTFVLTLGGTNDGDIVYIHDVFWTYRKKLVTS